MSPAEQKVLDAARAWTTERMPMDSAEKALFAAVFRAFPGDANTKESCDCGDADCDECPTAAQVEAMISACESEATAAESAV